MAEYCLKCREEPRTVSGMHHCRGYKTVMDPTEYRSFSQVKGVVTTVITMIFWLLRRIGAKRIIAKEHSLCDNPSRVEVWRG